MTAAVLDTAPTDRAGSAYPVPVADLTDRVRDQAAGLGAWPSLRQVMTAHRVGRPKAAAALDALRAAGFIPADGPAAVEPPPVPATATDTSMDARGAADAPEMPDPSDGSMTTGAPPMTAGPAAPPTDASPLLTGGVDAPESAGVAAPVGGSGRWRAWPLLVISLGAFVSIWGGWVGLGEMTGFGPIQLLPGIADHIVINSAITLPLGVEAYAAFALRAWLAPDPGVSGRARRFACWSAVGALGLGAAGQIAYHLMAAAEITVAPWPITAFVSCLPVLVLGCGAALTHLTHTHHHHDGEIQ